MQHTYLQRGKYNNNISLLLLFICLYTFSAINFQGQCIRPVSYNTFLSRFRLPWPLSGCFYAMTLFVVSNNKCIQYLAHLKQMRSVHPASPILLTKIGPQRKKCIQKNKVMDIKNVTTI